MSVWLNGSSAPPTLEGSEGALVSISIDVDPRHLESLLEALANLKYPVNPEIYHDAAIVYHYPDGRDQARDTTLVEFPAYAGWVEDVRRAIEAFGFERSSVHVTGMLDEIHSAAEPAPAGAAYVTLRRLKRRAAGEH